MTLPDSTEHSLFKTWGPLDPVNDSAIHVARPELERLVRVARANTIDAYLALLGSRQTGKTTLLYQMRARLRQYGIGVALIDLTLLDNQPEDQLYAFIASEMRTELAPIFPRGTVPKDLIRPTNSITFRQFLFDVARQAQTPRIVILLDEVETIRESVATPFFGTIRHVFSSRRKEEDAAFEKYFVVLSGAHELQRLAAEDRNSPLHNITDRIYLKDFDVAGVQTLVANFARLNIAAPRETAQLIFDHTAGHPYLTQKMCQVIEQTHPHTITAKVVDQTAAEILRNDGHVERILRQAQEHTDATIQATLRDIVIGKPVNFNRHTKATVKLEMLGLIREVESQCVVRNAIYLAALQDVFDIPAEPPQITPPRRFPLWRVSLLLIALVTLLVNLPFLYVYATDILLTSRSINTRAELSAFGATAIVRYDPILRANADTPTQVRVEVEKFSEPLMITLNKDQADDISLEGAARRELKPPASQERFAITLNQHGAGVIPYNPFNPRTEERRVELIVQPANRAMPTHTIPLTFRVDFYSGFIISIGISLVSALAFVLTVLGNLQKIRDGWDRLTRPNK